MKSIDVELQDLIYANHILHYQNVVDAFGHVSLRHPDNSAIFIMSASKAPALVSGLSDLVHYNVSDSSPVEPNAKLGYQERFIHGEIYKRFPDINCVIHSHAESVIPYTMSGVELRPVFHMAGFLGNKVPVFDITELYKAGERQDFLVNSERFGSALAEKFANSGSNSQDCNVVLMANHGFTTLGSSIMQAVYRAVYTRVNAGLQTTAIMLKFSTGTSAGEGATRFLTPEQALGSDKTNDAAASRPWHLWVEQVKSHPLYYNETSTAAASEQV